MNKGKIVQVMGPVVDVVFEQGELPDIREALEVENNGKKMYYGSLTASGKPRSALHYVKCQ